MRTRVHVGCARWMFAMADTHLAQQHRTRGVGVGVASRLIGHVHRFIPPQRSQLFLRCREEPPIFDNLSRLAGAITWARALADRFAGPMAKFRALPRAGADSDEALEVAMTAITELFDTVKEVPADKGKFLCANMSFWSLRMKEDEAAAVKWAERGLAMIKDSEDPQDERLRSFFEDMLDE